MAEISIGTMKARIYYNGVFNTLKENCQPRNLHSAKTLFKRTGEIDFFK